MMAAEPRLRQIHFEAQETEFGSDERLWLLDQQTADRA